MTFLISFGVAILFVLACGKRLKAKPVPFYMGAVVIAVAVAAVTWSGLALPPWFARVIWPVFARGGLAGSLFILVMFAGALPNGSRPIKRLMPIRGPLSILASILTLGHNAAYGKVYFLKLFADPASLPVNQLLAAVCSLLMLVIMLPLFVTSFLTVRRKMPPKRWKALQRWAYLFYFLLGAHLLLLSVPEAMAGKPGYRLTAFLYGGVFLTYWVCRGLKALAVKGRLPRPLAGRQVRAGICCIALAGVIALGLGTGPANIAEAHTDSGYRDGVYTGSAMGMNGPVEVQVTVTDGVLAEIQVTDSQDDEPYFSDALAVIDEMLAANGTEVDTVTGATWSSGGIIDAVDAALESAVGG